MLLAMPMSAKIVKPVDDLSNPYFEDVATRDSFINCKKPIWTSDWKTFQPIILMRTLPTLWIMRSMAI